MSGARSGSGRTRTLFKIAAESLVASGLEDTVAAALHARVLRGHAEGLRQYLAIRLGSIDEGERLVSALRARLAALPAAELAEHPGPRARIYRLARELAAAQREALGSALAPTPADLPFRPGPMWAGPEYAAALSRVRGELEAEDAELLELAYARELDTPELAFVLDLPFEEARRRLERALGRARALARGAESRDLGDVLVEAFALGGGPARSAAAYQGAQEPLPEGTVVGGRYAIEQRVGAGAFGEVYRATDTEVPGHVVALKLLHQPATSEHARQAALRELHLIASVFHPSVVQLKAHGWWQGRLWFVMPWYEGETLESRMSREPLARDEARWIFERLARALATMHEAGIRHQDIKPENIFLARLRGYGRSADEAVLPVLLDLGVAAKEAEVVLAGTPTYFAPEVAAGFARLPTNEPITSKADIFSLALALRDALEPSTRDDLAAGAVERFIERRATEVPGPPTGKDLTFLRPSFERWLARSPDDRPTADELADELRVLTGPEERAARRSRILRWAVPLGLSLVAIFGSVVFALSRQAAVQALEAERARSEAAAVRVDLDVANQQRESLETLVADARARYESSDMTREQLAGQLAETEGERELLGGQLADEQARGRALRARLGEAEELGERLERELGQARATLASERQRATDLERTVAEVRASLAETSSRADRAEERVGELGAAAAALRQEAAGERARAETAGRELAAAEAALRGAQGQLAGLERRVAELEQRLAQAEAARRRAEAEAAAARSRPTPAPGPAPLPAGPAVPGPFRPPQPGGTSPAPTSPVRPPGQPPPPTAGGPTAPNPR